MHCSKPGVGNHLVENDEHALDITRAIVSNLKSESDKSLRPTEYSKSIYSAKEFFGIVPDNSRQQIDMREIFAQLVDGSDFNKCKMLYAYNRNLVC